MSVQDEAYPFHVFRFEVSFQEARLDNSAPPDTTLPLCSGAFQECTGLEATMEPKVIKAGGQNYGPAQRSGPVTFSTVILKRGITKTRDLWNWFYMMNGEGKYAYRLSVTIKMQNLKREPVLL